MSGEAAIGLRRMLEQGEAIFGPLCAEFGALQWVTDLDANRCLYVNSLCWELLELSREEIYLDRNAGLSRIHPDDRDGVIAAFQNLAEAKRLDITYRLVMPSGRRRWLRCRAHLLPPDASHGRWIAGLALDVTRQKTVEIRLAVKRELTRLITRAEAAATVVPKLLRAIAAPLDCAAAGLWIVDDSRNVMSCGAYWHRPGVELAAFAETSGQLELKPGEDLPGRCWARRETEVSKEPEDELTSDRSARARAAGLRTIAEFPVCWNDELLGVLELGSAESPASDAELQEAIAGIAGLLAGYLERNRLDAAARREKRQQEFLAEQLRQSQKMEAVGRLAGGVAHDFNNLLQIINGYTELLADALESQPQARDWLGQVRRSGQRAAGLTRQLLAFSRKQALETRVLDLGQLVTEGQRMFLRLISEDIKVVLRVQPDLWRVRADAGQLDQVLMNLLVNARDAMPSGGSLTIEVANERFDDADQKLANAVPPGAWVRLSVTDTGIGIPPEIQSKIFEPFFTTKDRERGTGLGLSTVFGIVQQSSGHTRVYSEPGRGTTFHVYLPAMRAGAEAAPDLPAAPLATGNETVLVVEDQEDIRLVLAKMLRAGGYKVLLADDEEHAVVLARTHAEAIDLAICDMVMPNKNGPAVANLLRRQRPGIGILFMSGHTEHPALDAEAQAPDTVRLQKPFDRSTLLQGSGARWRRGRRRRRPARRNITRWWSTTRR